MVGKNFVILIVVLVATTITLANGFLFSSSRSCKKNLDNVGTIPEFLSTLENFKQTTDCPGEVFEILKELNGLIEKANNNDVDVCHPNYIDSVVKFDERFKKLMANNFKIIIIMKNFSEQFYRHFMLTIAKICAQNIYRNGYEADKQLNLGTINWKVDDRLNDPILINEGDKVLTIAPKFKNLSLEKKDLIELVAYLTQKNPIVDNKGNLNQQLLKPIVDSCRKYSNYYENFIMSIVHLANIGYAWNLKEVNYRACKDNFYRTKDYIELFPVTQCQTFATRPWYIATISCYPILQLDSIVNSNSGSKANVVSFGVNKENNLVENFNAFTNKQMNTNKFLRGNILNGGNYLEYIYQLSIQREGTSDWDLLKAWGNFVFTVLKLPLGK